MQERQIHRLFEVSVLMKGAHALLECVGGLALAFTSTQAIARFVQRITQDELSEDKFDFIANWLRESAAHFSVATHDFYVFYLLSHGVVKLALVVGLLRRQLWAYPASLVVMGLFIAYQLYRYSYTHGFGLILLTLFDLIVIGLIWHEYQLMRRHLPVE